MKKTVYTFLGDFYHSHDLVFNAIQTVADNMENIEIKDMKLEALPDVLALNPPLIIMDLENRVNPEAEQVDHWLTDEIDEGISTYIENGGSFFSLHATLASYPAESKFMKALKGYFLRHPEQNKPVRYQSNNKLPFDDKTPIDFEVMDEQYFVNCDEDNTNVFLRSSSVDGESAAGWNHEYGKGKVICIVPTHRQEGFSHQQMLGLIQKALIWAV